MDKLTKYPEITTTPALHPEQTADRQDLLSLAGFYTAGSLLMFSTASNVRQDLFIRSSQ